jgi:hypothetical protein
MNNPRITLIQSSVQSINYSARTIQLGGKNLSLLLGYHSVNVLFVLFFFTARDEIISFEKLCICTGASPKIVVSNPLVIAVRDTDTVEDLFCRLKTARTICIVGNGGIAVELVHLVSEE